MTSNDIKLSLIFAARTDIGLVRTENQDSFGKFPEDNINLYDAKGQLFIVADGMGGHKGGKEASSIAVSTVISEYMKSSFEDSKALQEAIETANSTIYNRAGHSDEFGRMGTTCSVLLLKNEKGIIGHVGDSRIYKIENNRIEQLTDDHTKVQEMLREGILTAEEAKNYPSKSVLARALGVDERVRVDIISDIQLKKGQSYVLCSDGLGKVTQSEILPIVSNRTPTEACKFLVSLANERGGKDNVTVIVIKIDPDYSKKVPEPVQVTEENRPKPVKKHINLKWPAVVLFILLILLVLFFVYKPSFLQDLMGSSITQNETDEQKLSDEDEKLLSEADNMVVRREYDNALNIYKKILDKEPMHQAALKGISEIATAFLSNANNLMYLKRFDEALIYYKKVEAIQPDNELVKNRIKLCTSQLGLNPAVDSSMIKETPVNEGDESGSQVTRFDLPGWSYPGSNKNEFTISSHEIDFTNTLSGKYVIYDKDLFDVTLVVSTVINNKSSTVGLIIGYNSSAEYYLFKHHPGGEYILQKVQGDDVENLLVIKPDNSENPDRNLLKIQFANNLISIYNENGLLSSYKSIWGIYGKAGLFIDKNSTAKFQNIFLNGKTKLD